MKSKKKSALAWGPLGAALFIGILLLLVFRDELIYMVVAWEREEYNHGYLNLIVAIYLLWLRAERFGQVIYPDPGWPLFLFWSLPQRS